jgi:hypothetical protein
MRYSPYSVLAVVFLMSACACASDPGSESATPRRRSELITREELASMTQLSAFEAIRLLRPRWLQRRGNVTIGGAPLLPVVMVDRARFGVLDDLKDLSVRDVESIRFIPGRDATTIYGTGYGGGIIEVTTRHR